MMRLNMAAASIVSAVMLAGCSGKNNENPLGPSPTPTPSPSPGATVRSVVLQSTSTSTSTFQMSARADMSDGSTRDVTRLSKWETSNPTLAVVSDSGVLNVVGSGQVEVRATYESVTGAMGLLVSGPPKPSTYALAGTAVEATPVSKILQGVRLQVVEGADAGMAETTDMNGTFRFSTLKPGTITIEATKEGYLPWRVTKLEVDRDRQIQVVLYPIPPKDASGADATARCKDNTWSWDKTRTEACAANGGIAYTVCPGPMCELNVTR
jgi:hypothetical protein